MRTRPAAGWLVGVACALCVLTAHGQQGGRQQEPAAPLSGESAAGGGGGGSVTGRVTTVPAGQRTPEMIVFLESTDPGFRFAPPAEPVVVSQRNARFLPGLVVVSAGTRVDFRNDEQRPVEHNVFSNSEAKKFDLGLYEPGERVEPVLLDKPGVVRLRCSIHRYMDGVVYVTPTPYFAAVRGDGTFEIAGVRPGAYRLRTWQRSPRYREQSLPVTVAEGAPIKASVELNRR